MNNITLRPARPQDFAFCQRLYVEGAGKSRAEPRTDEAWQIESCARQWPSAEVRIIRVAGNDVGWLQTAPTDDATDLGQLYVARGFQRQGIGRGVLQVLIGEARRDGKAITLGVASINPARRLYERLGFRVTHEDCDEVYMRRETGQASA
jgi:ribosomal protein S18 acetylase RimI-like enzyme